MFSQLEGTPQPMGAWKSKKHDYQNNCKGKLFTITCKMHKESIYLILSKPVEVIISCVFYHAQLL